MKSLPSHLIIKGQEGILKNVLLPENISTVLS